MKIRIRFAKYGKMVYIGHLDIMRFFQKVLRRANVDIVYTQGFNPHPILSFAAPLGVGITSCGEYADFEVASTDSTENMIKKMNSASVDGIEIMDYRLLPDNAKNAMSSVAAADYCLTFRDGKAFDAAINGMANSKGIRPEAAAAGYLEGFEKFLLQPSIVIQKETKKGSKELDIRPLIYDCCLKKHSETGDGPAIFLQVSTGSVNNLKPELILKAYHEQAGIEWRQEDIAICRLETYANTAEEGETANFVPLIEAGSLIKSAIKPDSEEVRP